MTSEKKHAAATKWYVCQTNLMGGTDALTPGFRWRWCARVLKSILNLGYVHRRSFPLVIVENYFND